MVDKNELKAAVQEVLKKDLSAIKAKPVAPMRVFKISQRALPVTGALTPFMKGLSTTRSSFVAPVDSDDEQNVTHKSYSEEMELPERAAHRRATEKLNAMAKKKIGAGWISSC